MTINDKRTPDADSKRPGFRSMSRSGVWYLSNAVFPMEDPTNAGSGKPLTRFEEKSYTQAEPTAWAEGQWKAGVFKKFDGDPQDDGTKEIVYLPPTIPEVVLKVPNPEAQEGEEKKAMEDGDHEAAKTQARVQEEQRVEAEKVEKARLQAEHDRLVAEQETAKKNFAKK